MTNELLNFFNNYILERSWKNEIMKIDTLTPRHRPVTWVMGSIFSSIDQYDIGVKALLQT